MSMPGYTKLFNSILASTIWEEDNVTRIVWITMLAMADKSGVVEGSIPGLATFARVTPDDTREALDCLSRPDPDSRSQEYEGRRIAKVDGGWQILNHAKYRAKLNADERREYNRVKKAESRQHKSAPVKNVNDKSALSAHTEAEADPKAVKKTPYGEAFEKFWACYPRKVGKDAAWAVWQRLKPDTELAGAMIAAVETQKRGSQWTRDGGQFIPHPKTWLSQGRWQDESTETTTPSPTIGRGRTAGSASQVDANQRIRQLMQDGMNRDEAVRKASLEAGWIKE